MIIPSEKLPFRERGGARDRGKGSEGCGVPQGSVLGPFQLQSIMTHMRPTRTVHGWETQISTTANK